MKLTLLITAILIANINSEQYTPSVPQSLTDIFSVVGTACSADSDCDNLFNPNNISSWTCVNETFLDDNTTIEPFCLLTQCVDDTECETNEVCYKINPCDGNNQFYAELDDLYSTVCQANTLCEDIKEEGEWTSDTMCYIGEDEEIYYSEVEAIMCGASLTGTCVASTELCVDTDDDKARCKMDKTCCTKDGWNQNGCIDLLFTEYILYTVIVLAAIVFCCCLCCCCVRKMNKKGADYDDVDKQTNDYNVYI